MEQYSDYLPYLVVVVLAIVVLSKKNGGGGKSMSIPVGLNIFEMAIFENAAYRKEMVYFDNPRFHHRLAWFFEIVGGKPRLKGTLEYRVDQTIKYLEQAGIDYLIHHGPGIDGGFGLLPFFQRHVKSKTKMRFVWALFGSKNKQWTMGETERMIDKIIPHMKDPRWQKINGRPIFQVMRPLRFSHLGVHNVVRMIRKKCIGAGVGDPWIIGQGVERGDKHKDVSVMHNQAALKKVGFDALTEYSATCGAGSNLPGQSMSYKGATKMLIDSYAKFTGLPIIPYGEFEAYPEPRAVYRGKQKFHHYAQAKGNEISERIRKVNQYAADNRNNCLATTQWYSGGERSEYGCMFPTMDKKNRIYNQVKKALK